MLVSVDYTGLISFGFVGCTVNLLVCYLYFVVRPGEERVEKIIGITLKYTSRKKKKKFLVNLKRSFRKA